VPSFFTARNWAKLIHSGGQSEQGAQMAAANMCAASINLADGENWDDWVKTRESLKAAGLRVVVGGRVINFGNALDGVETLLEIAIEHDVDCVANIEDEFKDTTPAAFEERISSVIAANPQWKREFVINTIGWLYNAVDFTPLNHRPVVLQCYPSDNKWAQSEVEQSALHLQPLCRTEHCLGQFVEKKRAACSIDYPVIGGERQRKHGADGRPS